MPPFSGKMKKEQLKARRQRKRQEDDARRQQEAARDAAAYNEIINRDHTVDTGHEEDPSLTPPEPEVASTQDTVAEHQNSSDARARTRGKPAQRSLRHDEFQYSADRTGIRSIFAKETNEELEIRRRLNYEPLAQRDFMTPLGVPFGLWFGLPAHETAADGSLVETPAERGASRSFLFSFEIPSRVPPRDDKNKSRGEAEGDGGGFDNRDARRQLEALENDRFMQYLERIDHYQLPPPLRGLQLCTFERNLDVWRQLWRTVEASDVVMVVADARYPLIHLPLSLIHYILREARKPCLIVLNKADLVPKGVLHSWIRFLTSYFTQLGFIGNSEDGEGGGTNDCLPPLTIRPFTASPAQDTAVGAEPAASDLLRRRAKKERRGKMYEQIRRGTLRVPHADGTSAGDHDSSDDDDGYASNENFAGKQKAEQNVRRDRRTYKELEVVSSMVLELLNVCRALGAPDKGTRTPADDAAPAPSPATQPAPLVAPTRRARKARKHKKRLDYVPSSDSDVESEASIRDEREADYAHFVHVGLVGHPNVGKSSLLNCMRGAKVVSVSATPGHTKHLQTIPMASHAITLVDCPGLAFPVVGLPRPMQAVLGTQQIAQVRDPLSAVAYLASHLPLEKLYGLRPEDDADVANGWSAHDICEAYARKKSYYVKRGKGTLDLHRAAIALLQEAYEGRLALFFAAPELNLLQSARFATTMAPFLMMPVLDHPE